MKARQLVPILALVGLTAGLSSVIPGWASELPVRGKPLPPSLGEDFPQKQPSTAGGVKGWWLGEKGINVAGAWAVTKGKGVKVAMLGGGIDADHPKLKGQILDSKDFTGGKSGTKDVFGIGTHPAGIVAMKEDTNGSVGVAPECRLLVGKVFDDNGAGNYDWAIAGLDWAIERKADVIWLGFGSVERGSPDEVQPKLRAAIKKAVAANIIVVVPSGSEGNRSPVPNIMYPGRFPECITIGASTIEQRVADFSGRGPELDGVAPGVNMTSAMPNNQFTVQDGTSSSSAVVAGVAALYVAAKRSKSEKPSVEDFRKLIETTSFRKVAVPNYDVGWGLIQADKIVSTVVGGPIGKTAELVPADFTPAGWAKVKALAPGATGITLEAGGQTGLKAIPKK